MGLFGQSKKEKELQEQINFLRSQLNPAQQNALAIHNQINQLEGQKKFLEQELAKLSQQLQSLNARTVQLNAEIAAKSSQIVDLNDSIDMQQYGLYKPTFVFSNSDLYKERLKNVRDQQKAFIKRGLACTGNVNWTINGNVAQGKKMVKDMQKLLLRAFNVECDDIVANVKISNFEKSKERMTKIKNQISDLGSIMSISICPEYLKLKIEELQLALDFAQKKQEEKERIKEFREQQREEAKVQKEIEEKRKQLKREQNHYMNAVDSVNDQIKRNGLTPELIQKRDELMSHLSDIEKAIEDVDYREANKRAGHVYIISNIGAFGENVYKIGMTRREDPMDRVNELGDASVPFNFDVHAFIFSDDAPSLEAALHHAFESKKVNKINGRREFFHVTLDEIKRVVRANFDKTVEWVDVAEAEQYRQSLIMDPASTVRVPNTTPPPAVVNSSTPPASTNRNPVRPDNNQIPPPTSPARTAPQTVESIVENLKSTFSRSIPDFACTPEEKPDSVKLHIYTTGSRKIGIVQVMKTDMTIQVKKVGGQYTDVPNAEHCVQILL